MNKREYQALAPQGYKAVDSNGNDVQFPTKDLNYKVVPQECDVTKCAAYLEHNGEYHQGYWEFNEICQEFENHCSDNPNCDFKTKQLLQLKAENDKLTQKLKKAREALEVIMNDKDEFNFENYTAQ